ncbi:hypothetical protein [Nocardioides sp.]|uniref:hypothetical protein n=1 Tax=Nocardioides sp. TaxID=35761 RepID=UPI0019892A7B|nr:hypothetical protein [Nocardioides sp.]MBC7277791.1 hypothetical protein [Nocardioides sp.]
MAVTEAVRRRASLAAVVLLALPLAACSAGRAPTSGPASSAGPEAPSSASASGPVSAENAFERTMAAYLRSR